MNLTWLTGWQQPVAAGCLFFLLVLLLVLISYREPMKRQSHVAWDAMFWAKNEEMDFLRRNLRPQDILVGMG
jgi:hypothetical protein